MKATTLIKTLSDDVCDRDAILLQLLRRGEAITNYVWVNLGNGLEIQVPRGPVLFGEGDDLVALGTTAFTQQQMADLEGAVLLTPKLCDLLAGAALRAGALSPPHPQPITASTAGYARHSRELLASLGCETWTEAQKWELIAGWKDWCVSLDVWAKRGYATNYGWHVPAGRPAPAPLHPSVSDPELRVIQPAAEAHTTGSDFDGDGDVDSGHGDYSQLLRWAKRACRWQGQKTDLAAIYLGQLGPEATAAASHEGALPAARLPGVPFAGAQEPPGGPTPPRVTRLGERGEDVVAWQLWLMRHGYDIGRWGADGKHGAATEAATEAATHAWLARNGAPTEPPPDTEPESVVIEPGPLWTPEGISFRQARYYQIGRDMGDFPDDVEWVQVGERKLPRGIVFHLAEMSEVSYGAEALQTYCATMADGRVASWHFSVDNNSITQSVRIHDTAFGAGPANEGWIHVELAGRTFQGAEGWADDYSQAQLRLAAKLTAYLCDVCGFPPVRRDAQQLLAHLLGLTDHDAITQALAIAKRRGDKVGPWWSKKRGRWRSTTHVDGLRSAWPQMTELVRIELQARRRPR